MLTDPSVVCYATGYAVPIETGPSPFAGGPATAIVTRDGQVALIGADLPNTDDGRNSEAFSYAGFHWKAAENQWRNYLGAVEQAVRKLKLSGCGAVEQWNLPRGLLDIVPRTTIDISGKLNRARAVKTKKEILALTEAATVAAKGQEKARLAASEGVSELLAFSQIRAEMEIVCGSRCAVAGDFLTGASVPYEDAVVETDMVLMVEPGVYMAGHGGVRLELMLHVGRSGTRSLAQFPMSPTS